MRQRLSLMANRLESKACFLESEGKVWRKFGIEGSASWLLPMDPSSCSECTFSGTIWGQFVSSQEVLGSIGTRHVPNFPHLPSRGVGIVFMGIHGIEKKVSNCLLD